MLYSFLEFCRDNLRHSFAQNFQDLFALWVSGGKRDGYFVEFGALNGRDFSNTYMLEKLGWNGIVAEPHPSYADKVPAVRNCHFSTKCVYDKTGDTVEFRTVVGRPALSAIGATQLNDSKSQLRSNYNSVQVSTITLNDLLDEYAAPYDIDFISIDTEGSESKILSAFDFGKRRIRSFCIEHNSEQRAQLTKIMKDAGYENVFPEVSGHDDWWILADEVSKLPQRVNLDVSQYSQEVFDTALNRRQSLLDSHLSNLKS